MVDNSGYSWIIVDTWKISSAYFETGSYILLLIISGLFIIILSPVLQYLWEDDGNDDTLTMHRLYMYTCTYSLESCTLAMTLETNGDYCTVALEVAPREHSLATQRTFPHDASNIPSQRIEYSLAMHRTLCIEHSLTTHRTFLTMHRTFPRDPSNIAHWTFPSWHSIVAQARCIITVPVF